MPDRTPDATPDVLPAAAAARVDAFREQRWTAGVIGLGYVGLPLAVTAAARGLDVIGYDISQSRVDQISDGVSHVEDVTDAELAEALAAGARFTTDLSALAEADAIFIAVPSPLGRNRQPDMTFIESAADAVATVARAGQLISLESTTYPGTTEEYLVPAVQRAGLTVDEDVFITFSPERVDPGNTLHTADIPKVVGGVSPVSGAVGAAAYLRLVNDVHVVSSARAAELTKLLENTYRAVNIAMVNELAQVADVFDIDIWEVIDAAATKPFGFQAFYPGPGVGGHCIPLDPQFLAWRARELKVATRFIDLAEDINLHMPEYVVSRLTAMLNDAGKALRGANVVGVGIAYKRNIADERESPSMDVLRLLAKRGANVRVLDPHVADERIRLHGFTPVDAAGDVGDADVVMILTDHDAVDYDRIAEVAPLVFDTRGVYRRRGVTADHVVSL